MTPPHLHPCAAAAAVVAAGVAGCGGGSAPPAAPTPRPAIAYSEFVRAEPTRFTLRGKPYFHLGANFWGAMNLASAGPGGDRARLARELDRLQALGLTSLRILGGSEGPDSEPYRVVPSMQKAPGQYDDAVVDGLDFLVAEMKKRGMVAVVCLNDTWPWSGGMAAYLMWHGAPRPPYPMEPPYDWWAYQEYVVRFYSNPGALADFRKHIAFLVGRTNRYTGVAYRDEPAIMAWELANEPRGGSDPAGLHRFIDETAGYIKSLDPNHLVTTGSEGTTNAPAQAGLDFVRDHASRFIDYATFHFWAQNWGFYDPRQASFTARPRGQGSSVDAGAGGEGSAAYAGAKKHAMKYIADHVAAAARLGKPAVLEEFGLARDGGSFDPRSPVTVRDQYYDDVFREVYRRAEAGEPMASASFWAWGGEGRPATPGGAWKPGAPLIGDPPHEAQGWYSVYDSDASTLGVVGAFAGMMAVLNVDGAGRVLVTSP